MGENKANIGRAWVWTGGKMYGPKWEDYVASLTPPPNKAISGLAPADNQDSLQSKQD